MNLWFKDNLYIYNYKSKNTEKYKIIIIQLVTLEMFVMINLIEFYNLELAVMVIMS
jgi:hypothetical protein